MAAQVKATRIETIIGVFILVVLAVIGSYLFNRQFRLNPAVVALQATVEKGEAGQQVQQSPLVDLPAGIKPLSLPEAFDRDTLFEKIDGQAEAYLAAGFVALKSQRYAPVENPESWLEVFVYDMGADKNAFSIFSTQRRSDAAPLKIGQFAYATQNALFLTQGRFYLQVIAAAPDADLYAKMKRIAQNFVTAHPVTKKEITGLSWFPEAGLDPKSVTLVSTDAFGFAGFNNVFTAYYPKADLTAFVCALESDQAAKEKATAFYRFYKEFGGNDQQADIQIENGRVVEIMDSFAVVFSKGRFVAGVNEAQDKKQAIETAQAINRKLDEVSRGQ